ncbi:MULTISPECIES: hypothetical protein [Serratia]|uniref:hypothetical protein n=1 Tax=Serratia TaxID=613 RepID=UPI0010C4C02A|nr:hypothetical protein [Serratia bockelmannii]AVU30188.1 hypothetical protein AS657_09545 [Serratia marcescens]MBH2723724.1 hypothetical protein [Serratia marcescens]MBH2814037.1 hypothetical protein [Serratia marcescens]QDI13467.1 hypothetical protein FBF84_09995 [Serratia marcescens]QDI23209.1 hypothetical protein FBF90_09995 [Serratia marcescens]
MKNSNYQNIKKEIQGYAKDMNDWWGNLQKDSVAEWTFLTTLGCWGVPNHLFQIISFILAILFFSVKLLKIKNKNPFSKTEILITKKINEADLDENEKEALFCKLNKVKKFRHYQSTLFILKRNWRFIISYTFLMMSFLSITIM